MRKIYGSLILGLLVAACGGGADTQPPVVAPPAPVAPPPEPAPVASAAPAAPAKPSAQDMAKNLVGSVMDALSAHDTTKLLTNYTDDATVVMAGVPEPIKGKEAIASSEKRFLDAFPNVKFAASRVWAKKDVVVVEWVWNGTHSGDLMGIKATEKPAGVTGLTIVWMNDDGKVKEEHRYADFATVMGQIGAAPKGVKVRAIPAMPSSVEWHWAKGTADEDKSTDLAKAAYTAFEKKDEKAFSDLNADDVTWDDMMAPAPSKGKAEAIKMFKMFGTAFPDIKMTPTNTWGVEDFAIAELVTTGTQKGAFMGIPASKKAVNLHNVDIVQIKDGKSIKGWSYGNGAELLMQVGVMKPPGAGGKAADPKAAAPKADPKAAAPKAAPKK